jgi:hypothetical protein
VLDALTDPGSTSASSIPRLRITLAIEFPLAAPGPEAPAEVVPGLALPVRDAH